MKKAAKIILGVLFLVILLGTFVFLWQKTRPKKVIYTVETTKIDTIEKRVVATGKVEPRDEVLIKPQIAGIISEVNKEAGEMVRVGDVIAKVQVVPAMDALTSAEYRLNTAQLSADQSNREFTRVKELYSHGVISKEEYEKSETDYNRILEDLQNAKDNLDIVRSGVSSRNAELSNTQIRATINGMILDVPIKVGNSVVQTNNFNDGTTIASIADLNDMIFRGKVDETEVGRLTEGMPVKITVGAMQETTLQARLEYVAPKGTEENGVVMFEIKAAVSIPSDVFVRAGYSANAEIIIDRREGILTVPESSVIFEGDQTYVMLLTSAPDAEEQTFERKDVKLGLSNGVSVEITEGLDGTENLRGIQIVN